MTHQRHEEAKRERRRAEREKRRGLVPLMPILVKLGACEVARSEIARLNCATFAELWETKHEMAGEWRQWLLNAIYDPNVIIGHCHQGPTCLVCAAQIERGERIPMPTTAEVERALCDYAVREGLA